jgi:hypothetical protein
MNGPGATEGTPPASEWESCYLTLARLNSAALEIRARQAYHWFFTLMERK